MNKRLIDNWRGEIKRLWTIRLTLFWGLLNGAVLGLAALSDVINPWAFLGLNMLGYATIAVGRLLKQPGAEQ